MEKLQNEKILLAKAKNGDLRAFEKILSFYEKSVFNYLYRIAGQKQDAEDLTQETFIKIYKSLKTVDPEKNFKSWLFKIATNTAYDWLRKKKSDLNCLSLTSHSYSETINDDHAYLNIENALDFKKLIEKLSPIHRSVLMLHYYNDLSYKEISEALSLPLNTVKTHLYRAKRALLSIIKNENEKPT